MAADIVFEQDDLIKLEAARVCVTGRVNLPRVQGAEPLGGGEYGDLVITVEKTHNPVLNIDMTTTRLWLCVEPEGMEAARPGQTFWREVQLGSEVVTG
jgi:hypothetical protein